MSTNEPENELNLTEKENKIVNDVRRITFLLAYGMILLLMLSLNYHRSPNLQPLFVNQFKATEILTSMQTGVCQFVNKQKRVPEAFSDFLVIGGDAKGSKTLTLEENRRFFSKIKGYTTKKLTLEFIQPDNKYASATYYLNGTDVTAELKGF